MPSNQQPSNSSGQPASTSRSPLVRSKSLRLPTSKSKAEPSSSTLTRHGSIRQPKAQAASNVKQQPLSVLRKPLVKPKPPAYSSKSTENLDKVSGKTSFGIDGDARKPFPICRSPTKHVEGHHFVKGVTFLSDSHPTPSDSPTSLHSDRSQPSQDASSSWSTPDLAVHLKRLTEEHEKLQVEYARVRMQLLENSASHPTSFLRRDHQHLSQSDSHLASIPENSLGNGPNNQNQLELQILSQEALLQGYRAEIFRLQEDNRKLQRKYWEQILNSESIEDELNGGASQQVVELIDKLDDKHRDLVQASGRAQELDNHLAATTLELHQCQDALQDYQHMLEDANSHKDRLDKQLKETLLTLAESSENVDFLQVERSTIAEALQEAEQSLAVTKAEMQKDQVKLNDLMDRARKLYSKVKDKNLQIQLLQAELDRTEGRARDLLLFQGAELTMTAMYISQISISLHSILTGASDFAAAELELQKEMLEEIMADLDSEGDKSVSSPIENDCDPLFKVPEVLESPEKNLAQETTPSDIYKSFPDIPSGDLPDSPLLSSSSGCSERPVSIVQSIIRAIEKSNKNEASKQSSLRKSSSDDSASNSVQSSTENLSNASGGQNKVSLSSTGAFRPVGTATPFRPVSQNNKELNPTAVPDNCDADEEKKKASLESQLNQLNLLLGKLTKVIDLMQGKYLSKMNILKEEINQLQEELKCSKLNYSQLHTELKIKSEQIVKMTTKLGNISAELNSTKKIHSEEKEALLQQVYDLKEKNKSLEVVNAEQSRQLKEEVQRIVESTIGKDNCEYFSNAVAICDKLCLKQEIVKLKGTISHKEELLQTLAQKFARTKNVLEGNLRKADEEVECLDRVIEKVFETLRSNEKIVESHPILQDIFLIVSGKVLPEDIKAISSNDVDSV